MTLQVRKDTTTNRNSITPLIGEPVWDTTTNKLYLGDGTTAGGILVSSAGITRSVNVISTPTTAGSAALTDYVYNVSGTTPLTLPTAVGNTNQYTVVNVGINTVTIATTSSQTINGSLTAAMPIANMSLSLISDGSNWVII